MQTEGPLSQRLPSGKLQALASSGNTASAPQRSQEARKGIAQASLRTPVPVSRSTGGQQEPLQPVKVEGAPQLGQAKDSLQPGDLKNPGGSVAASAGTASQVLLLQGTLNGRKITFLVDSGANGNFVSSSWMDTAHVKAIDRVSLKSVTFANGQSEFSQRMLPHARMRLQSHSENLSFDVIDLQGYDAILGKPWLTKHNPRIDWKQHQLTLRKGPAQLTIHGVLKPQQDVHTDSSATLKPLSACQFKRLVRKGKAQAFVAMVRAVPTPDIAATADSQPSHPIAKQLILEFQDVFPADLPKTFNDCRPAEI